ncbi:MAG: hypothetical protein A4S09_04860 [Proteobacteria bacterium SG_bin7]|nr:MAG: hypothetical protein A4S09_04860 [Proteobacteria bacterium SG_bin7]
MAFTEIGFFRLLKPVLGFDPKRPVDVICLLLLLGLSIYLISTGIVGFGFIFGAAFILAYFLLKGLLHVIGLMLPSHITIGWVVDRKYRKLSDYEKAILHCFVDDDTFINEFNLQKYPEIYFDRLKQKGFLDDYEATIPSSDRGRLEHALGNSFVEAKMNRRIFDYLTEDYCKNALRLEFTLYRADVKQRNRT